MRGVGHLDSVQEGFGPEDKIAVCLHPAASDAIALTLDEDYRRMVFDVRVVERVVVVRVAAASHAAPAGAGIGAGESELRRIDHSDQTVAPRNGRAVVQFDQGARGVQMRLRGRNERVGILPGDAAVMPHAADAQLAERSAIELVAIDPTRSAPGRPGVTALAVQLETPRPPQEEPAVEDAIIVAGLGVDLDVAITRPYLYVTALHTPKLHRRVAPGRVADKVIDAVEDITAAPRFRCHTEAHARLGIAARPDQPAFALDVADAAEVNRLFHRVVDARSEVDALAAPAVEGRLRCRSGGTDRGGVVRRPDGTEVLDVEVAVRRSGAARSEERRVGK